MTKERRKIIRELLATQPFVSLEQLIGMFPTVSSMTLRRDIEALEREGDAIKVRGGARSMRFLTASSEDAYAKRMKENMAAKERIARRAAEFVQPGRSVFIDSGTTMLTLTRHIPDVRLSVITTGPNIAMELSHLMQPIVHIIGGMLNRSNLSISGAQALRYITDFNIDTAFVSPSGYSGKDGFTGGNYSECELKREIIGKAHKTVVLMDSSKLEKVLPYTFCSMSDINVLITDKLSNSQLLRDAEAAGVEVIIAE